MSRRFDEQTYRSEPARSTIESRPRRTATRGIIEEAMDARSSLLTWPSSSGVDVHCSTRMSSMACEREDERFMLVLQVARFVADSCTKARTPSTPATSCSVSDSA